MERFDKIAGSDFEHQRFLLMARRAEGRTPGVILPAQPYIKNHSVIFNYIATIWLYSALLVHNTRLDSDTRR